MVHTFLESPSNLDVHPRIGFSIHVFEKIRLNWRLKVHYMAMSCSRRGPLRYVCGQTIDPTAMICTFLESPAYLDVLPGKHFALFAEIVETDDAEIGVKTAEFALCGQTICSPLCFLHLLHLFTFCLHTGDNVRLSDVVKFTQETTMQTSA